MAWDAKVPPQIAPAAGGPVPMAVEALSWPKAPRRISKWQDDGVSVLRIGGAFADRLDCERIVVARRQQPSWPPRYLQGLMSHVAILMCTFNGETFLAEQLASIEAQTHTDWRLHISDDGSSDATPTILAAFAARHGPAKVTLRDGPKAGFVANFLSLACDPAIDADYYAFADQDDIWTPDKLSHALDLIGATPDVPSLYCSRTRLVDENNREIGFSPLFALRPCFRNAIVQSIAGGNTMVFNRRAREIVAKVGVVAVPSHDWWLYLVTSSTGGRVVYDATPHIRYRVHAQNEVGANMAWADRMKRVRMLFGGRFRVWNEMNVAALTALRPAMTPESRDTFDRFADARTRSLLPRLCGLARLGVYRQTILGNIGLVAAAILRKM
jgi:hypothetical protein